MLKILGTAIALLLIIGFGYPFAKHAYQLYQVSRRLDSVMSPQDRAEFRDWKGDAGSFAKSLYDRCELTQGQGAPQCERYRFAFQER